MDFAAIRTTSDEIRIDSMAKKLSSSFPTHTTMPGTGAARRRLQTDDRKIKLETTTIGLPGALTHILDGQEMPMSDLHIPNDLKNVLEDLKANLPNQKRPKPIMIKERKTGVFLKFPSFVSSVSLSG